MDQTSPSLVHGRQKLLESRIRSQLFHKRIVVRQEWVVDESAVHGDRERMDGAVCHVNGGVSDREESRKDVRGVRHGFDLRRQHRKCVRPIPGKCMCDKVRQSRRNRVFTSGGKVDAISFTSPMRPFAARIGT
jgi:hypothetical protein